MSNKLKPYEISVWEDILVEEEDKTYYKEVKIATIGSDEMTAPTRVINPIFTTNVNGEITLTFDIVHKYYDPIEDDYIVNPLERFLVNERKVKLFYDEKWYDFIIKSCEESSESDIFSFTAKGLFVNELGKVGYSIVLSNDLKNNQGTIFELAEKAVKGTDWIIDKENSDIIQQFVAEPLYTYKVTTEDGFDAEKLNPTESVHIDEEEIVYLFYSTIANSQKEYVQFLREIDFVTSTLDDNNVAQMPNYRFDGEANYDGAPGTIVIGGVELQLQAEQDPQTHEYIETGINSAFQGYRLAYNQIVGYDTVKDRPVTIYEANYDDGSKKTIYKYTDYEYITSDVVTSYITSGSGFNIYGQDGGLEGWSNVTPTNPTTYSRSIASLKADDNPGQRINFIKIKEAIADLRIGLAGLVEGETGTFTCKINTTIQNGITIQYLYTSEVSQDTVKITFNNHTYTFIYNSINSDWSEAISPSLGNITDITTTPANANTTMINALKPYLIFTSIGTDTTHVLQPMELMSYPNISKTAIVDLPSLNGIRNYLKIKFSGSGGPRLNNVNTIYNSGFDDNKTFIGSLSRDEEYVFRIAYGTTQSETNKPLAQYNNLVKAVVAKYTLQPQETWNKETETKETLYVYKIDPNNILFDFTGPFVLKNNEITDGVFMEDENGKYVSYVRDGISVTPSVDYVYIEKGVDGNPDIVCVWDLENQVYKLKQEDNSFLDYYMTTARCRKAISNTELANSSNNYGIFLYTEDADSGEPLANRFVCIKDVQLFKAKRDGDQELVLIGNVPKSTALATDYYYLKPEESDTDPDNIETYSSLESLANSIGIYEENIKALYNENFEKISSIEASQSNCFNIIQDLCESFECWARFDIEHEKNGAIKLDSDGAPSKKISFHKYSGKDNFAGFKYGINLESIQRTIDSDEFVSKLIVEQVANDTVDGGTVSIAGAPSNPSGESYILNMSYYLNHGLIEDSEQYYKDYNKFIEQIKNKNLEYTAKKTQLQLASIARTQANSKVTGYQELFDKAADEYSKTLIEFKDLTGIAYDDYAGGNGYFINFVAAIANNQLAITYSKAVESIASSFFDINGDEILLEEISKIEYEGEIKKTYIVSPDDNEGNPRTINQIVYIGIVNSLEGFDIKEPSPKSYLAYVGHFNEQADILSQFTSYIWTWPKDSNNNPIYNLKTFIIPSEDNDTLINLVGTIYTNSQVMRDYEPLLDIAKEEKRELDLLIDGTKKYALTIATFSDVIEGVAYSTTKETLDDYIEGLKFTLKNSNGSWTIDTSTTEKTFSQDTLYTQVSFNQYPTNYQLRYKIDNNYYVTTDPITISIPTNGSKVFTLIPIEETKGIKEYMEQILDEKNEIEEEFYKKYSRFIQEGSWTSSDYIDDELYYLDALNVSRVNGQPKVSYNLAVHEISEQDGLQNYKFDVGDKTYIEDTQFFGYKSNITEKFYNTTAINDIIELPQNTSDVLEIYQVISGQGGFDHRAEFIYLDSNTIEITRKYSDASDNYIVHLSYRNLTPIREEVVVSEVEWHLDDPSENSITIQNYKTQFDDLFQRMAAAVQSVEYNSASYSRAASMLDEGGFINAGLLLKSLNELSGGFSLSGDNTITAGPDGIIIKDLNDPTRQMKLTGMGLKTSTDDGYNWNTIITPDGLMINTIDTQNVIIKDGDNPSFRWDTYGLNAYGFGEERTDLKTYVRFDKYGLYGVQNGEDFQASSLEDIKDVAQFGLLWDGFFIKNSYTDGYVSISSDDDFQVVANDQERIKIGALNQKPDGTYEYGIRITNAEGKPVFVTDDSGDIEMTGIVNAKGGTFTEEVRVGSSDSAIILRGNDDDAVIGSSQYFEDSSKGWAIKSDGDAIFNNITARGAIKTAVFEYEEIEAVGGIFIFRPSSTIKKAEISSVTELIYEKFIPEIDIDPNKKYYIREIIEEEIVYVLVNEPTISDIDEYYVEDILISEDPEEYTYIKVVPTIEPTDDYYIKNGDEYEWVSNPVESEKWSYYYLVGEGETTYGKDLYIQVENPFLFSIGDWCKVSNFNSEDPTTALEASGLTNVFEITDITDNTFTLDGGAVMFTDALAPIDYPEIMATISGENNVYEIQGDLQGLSAKYNYELYCQLDEEEIKEETEEREDSDTYPIAVGVPKDIIVTKYAQSLIIKYLGNIRLWPELNAELEELEESDESFLIIQVDGKTLFYADEGNFLYREDGSKVNYELEINRNQNLSYEIDSLVGGALISFANYPTSQSSIAKIDSAKIDHAKIDRIVDDAILISNNYGIGINSSDSAVNLPDRAITMFESYVDPEASTGIKITYAIRGIFGTLPNADRLAEGKNLEGDAVNTDIYNNMEGQQGVYTDNIYLGDKEQYLAFYDGPVYKKVLVPVGSPADKGYYELVDEDYQLSDDTEVDPEKTYYYIDDGKHFDIVGSSIDIALNDGDRMISIINASDGEVTINSDKVNTKDMVIGDLEGTHIHVTNNEIGFWYGKEDDEDNKTAYLSNNKLYIPYSVVLNEMEIGEKQTAQGTTPLWAWRRASNDNLRLVWLGGNE